MSRILILAAGLALLSGPALAQAPDPHAGYHTAPPRSDQPPTAGPAPNAAPTDYEADRHYSKAAMDAARARLAQEHGDMSWSKVTFEKLEFRPDSGPDGYAWEGRASFGGDMQRFELRSRGDGAHRLERAEIDALYSRAVSPWFNLTAGVRQDWEPHARTYATLGVGGLTPYQFTLDAALFLSDRGDLSARLEGAHDFRLTQRLILEPRAEVNFASGDDRQMHIGSGLSNVEAGLRLRYAVTSEFAPYVGVEYERRFGDTASFVRAAGEEASDTRLVLGLRTWF